MDESTLNDLLECSVCLERLNDSKVLPCQHFFCKKCLEVIVASQKELRCPECRILVESKIDDLPPNVLLMRILEGLKNSANQNSQTLNSKPETSSSFNSKIENNPSNIQRFSSTQRNNYNFTSPIVNQSVQFQQKTALNHPVLNHSHQISPLIRQNHPSGVQNIPKAFALYDFQSKEVGDLQFQKGDVILIKTRLDANWLYGTLNCREGAFPVNYVQIIVPLPVPQCIALYDFKMGPNEEEGCLTFKKGTVINVLRRVDQNWAEGRIGSNIGIFPIAFAELNSLAKHVLQQKETELTVEGTSKNKNPRITALPHISRSLPPIPALDINLSDSTNSSSSSSALMSPNSTCSSSSNSVSSSPIHQNKNKNSEKIDINARSRNFNKEKRNSLNGLTVNKNLSIAQSNRHSAEILSIPHENLQAQPQTVGQSIGNTSFTLNLDSSIKTTNIEPERSDAKSNDHLGRMNILKQSNIPPTLPWFYIAVYPYKPKKNDELELKKGCVYVVIERCLDGWFKGKNWLEKSGVFPGNYVAPLRTRDHQQLMQQKSHTQNVDNFQPANPYNGINSVNNILPELPPRNINNLTTCTMSSIWSNPDRSIDQVDSSVRLQKSNIPGELNENKNLISDSKDISTHKITSNHLLASTSSSVGNLMKRLTNIKRSKSPIPPNILQVDDTNSKVSESNNKMNNFSHPVHVRSGSCPSQLLQSLPVDTAKENIASGVVKKDSVLFGSQRLTGQKERPSLQNISGIGIANSINDGCSVAVVNSNSPVTVNMVHHRKTQSLDATCKLNQLTVNNSNKTPNNREGRFRCIVSYPPNSEFELELNVGDIVFVHRKQKNGWYKGTHSKTNKTGLFPASFVEPFL